VLLLTWSRALQEHVGNDHEQDALEDEIPLVLQKILRVQLAPWPKHIPGILRCLQASKSLQNTDARNLKVT